MKVGKEEQVEQIVNRYHDTTELLVSDTLLDGGTDGGALLLGVRLARAGLNQARGDLAVISRYGIWANTVRDHVVAARDIARNSGLPDHALEHLRIAANSLSAFADLQALFDTQQILRLPSYLER